MALVQCFTSKFTCYLLPLILTGFAGLASQITTKMSKGRLHIP